MIAIDLEAVSEAAVASRLAGAPVGQMSRVGGGRNSRVFRVETAADVFAFKQYPPLQDDPRDRLGVETKALKWMAAHGLEMVPRVIATDSVSNSALLSWVDGAPVQQVTYSDIDHAVAFLSTLRDLAGTQGFPATSLAAEACLSGVEIERQLRKRLCALEALEDESELQTFLAGEFTPALESRLTAARDFLSEARLPFERELEQSQRKLVPSDFGFHNAIREQSGKLTFIDFEYFGWDDPVKLTADVVLHPGTPVTDELRSRFQVAAERLYGGDPGFSVRLKAFKPLFGLRWGLILLNEFHPERWRRRILAGASDGWAEAKNRQLRAAREMLLNSADRGKSQ